MYAIAEAVEQQNTDEPLCHRMTPSMDDGEEEDLLKGIAPLCAPCSVKFN